MLRARLLVWWWWLAVARALPVSDQTASDWAWGWWESLPYLAWTEAEPPYLPLLDETSPSPSPTPSPIPGDDWVAWFYDDEQRASQRPHVREDLASMVVVDDWTPRMKREYLRETAQGLQQRREDTVWDA